MEYKYMTSTIQIVRKIIQYKCEFIEYNQRNCEILMKNIQCILIYFYNTNETLYDTNVNACTV